MFGWRRRECGFLARGRHPPALPPLRPGAPQPRPLPSAGAGGRGRAGVFNGSMLPTAGAAPGQAGPPARPQPPRSHQLQLQLRALRLPQSPAAITGKLPTPWGLTLGASLFVSLFPPGFTPGTTPVLAVHPDDSVVHCLGLSGLSLRFESSFFYPQGCPLSVSGLQWGGLQEPLPLLSIPHHPCSEV